jgi:hypothetical protein
LLCGGGCVAKKRVNVLPFIANGTWKFVSIPCVCFHQFFNFKQTRARRVLSAGFNTRNHHVTAQAFPKTFDEEFHFAGQHAEQSFGIRRADGNADVVAHVFKKGAAFVFILQHQPALPVDAVVVIGATEGIFMQADDQLVEQSFRAGGLTVACVHDVTDLRLLDIARRGRGFSTRRKYSAGGYRGRVDR